MKFSRLEAFDPSSSKEEINQEDQQQLSLRKKAEKGQFLLTHHKVKVKDPVNFMIWSKEPCSLVALIHTDGNDMAAITIWNVLDDKEVLTIKTGVTIQEIFFRPESLSERKFSLTNDAFCMVLYDANDDGKKPVETVIFHRWSFDDVTKRSLIIATGLQDLVPVNPGEQIQTELTLMTVAKKMHTLQIRSFCTWMADLQCELLLIQDDEQGQPRILRKVNIPTLTGNLGFPRIQDFKQTKILFHHYCNDNEAINKAQWIILPLS